MSLKRPFGKVRRIDRKQDQQEAPQIQKIEKVVENQQPKQSVSKTPMFTLGSKKGKLDIANRNNVYDVLKKNENSEVPTEHKQPIKLDLLKKKGPKLMIHERPPAVPLIPNEQESSTSFQAPRPTPLFRGKKINLEGKNRSREKVVIEEPEHEETQPYEGSFDNSGNKEDNNIHKRPDLKIKHKIPKSVRDIQKKVEQESDEVQIKRQQEQSYENNYNFTTNVAKIEIAQINMEIKPMHLSQQKIQKQRIRTQQLQKLLNLQLDLYEQLLSVSCVTEYQVYISKIKNGTLKNSMDQAFDQKSNYYCQTLPFDFLDFTNQFPQDYHNESNTKTSVAQKLNNFILKVGPVIEELIRPTSEVIMPPIFLLAFRPSFHKMVKCPHPVFIYEARNTGIVVFGQKLYITQNQITSVLIMNAYFIGGLDNGKIGIWTGINDKNTKFYNSVYQIIQSTNFQLPSYVNEDLQRNSQFYSLGKIVSLVLISSLQFYSLDEHGKLVHWRIQQNTYKRISLKGLKSINLAEQIQRDSLICYSLKCRNQIFFISCSQGILVWNGSELTQKLQIQKTKVIQFQLPKRSNLIYIICTDNSFRIFDQTYSSQLFKIVLHSQTPLQNIIVPELEHENRQISILPHIYISDQNAAIYEVNLLKNTNEQQSIVSSENNNRSIIYRTVNGFNNQFEIITMWNDLKCTKTVHKMNINLQKTIPNLKKIIEGNRKLHSIFESDYSIL